MTSRTTAMEILSLSIQTSTLPSLAREINRIADALHELSVSFSGFIEGSGDKLINGEGEGLFYGTIDVRSLQVN